MITRAQAEALLTLAESLEACERLDITLEPSYDGNCIYYPNGYEFIGHVTAFNIRLALNALIPKQET